MGSYTPLPGGWILYINYLKAFCPEDVFIFLIYIFIIDVHFIFWVTLQYYCVWMCICSSNCFIFGNLKLSHLVPMSPWHTSTIAYVFFFNCNFLALTQFQALWNASGSSCTGPAPRFVKSNISPSTSSYFHLKMVFETKIWTLSVFFAAGELLPIDALTWFNKEIYMHILTHM